MTERRPVRRLRKPVPVPILLAAIAALAVAAAAGASPPDPGPLNQGFWPHRGRLGIQVQGMTPELREHFEAPSDRGILVTRVESDLPGAAAGVQVGDVIVMAGDEAVRGVYDLMRAVGRVPEGGKLSLQVVRDEQVMTLEVAPRGEAAEWVDPEHWGDMFERGVRRGREELQRQMQLFEQRLEELERRLDQIPTPTPETK